MYICSVVKGDPKAPFSIAITSRYYWLIGLVSRVFVSRPGHLGSIPGRVIPKTLKMVLDTFLLNSAI